MNQAKQNMLEVYTFEAPAHWASALINGDTSSFSDADEAEFNAWLASHPEQARDVVSCEGESFIRRWNGLLTDMLEYRALRRERGLIP
jgi:hypothetical protein